MAEKYDVHVVGIDLSINMISFALEHAIGLNCAVEFEVADCTKKEYPDGTFDVIYSRDTILHIHVISLSKLLELFIPFYLFTLHTTIIRWDYFRTNLHCSDHSTSG